MNNPQFVIKVTSVLYMIGFIFSLLVTLLLLAGSAMFLTNSEAIELAMDATLQSMMEGSSVTIDYKIFGVIGLIVTAILAVSSIITLLTSLTGFKAANGDNPKKAMIFGIVNIVFQVLSMIGYIISFQLFAIITGAIGLTIASLHTVAARTIAEEGE